MGQAVWIAGNIEISNEYEIRVFLISVFTRVVDYFMLALWSLHV